MEASAWRAWVLCVTKVRGKGQTKQQQTVLFVYRRLHRALTAELADRVAVNPRFRGCLAAWWSDIYVVDRIRWEA